MTAVNNPAGRPPFAELICLAGRIIFAGFSVLAGFTILVAVVGTTIVVVIRRIPANSSHLFGFSAGSQRLERFGEVGPCC